MIEIHRSDAAKMLRRVRERSDMTLKDAASAMEFSQSLLARKERGEARIERTDIRNAVEIYNLAPWEAYELWLSAGFTPEKTLIPISMQEVYKLANELLNGLSFPATLMDAAGYIRAWNGAYELMCRVSSIERDLQTQTTSEVPQVHMIDVLFSEHAQQCLSESWEGFADQTIERFYRQTIQIANEPFFPSLMTRLKDLYGEKLIRQWNQAQTYTPPQGSIENQKYKVTVHHSSEIGVIEYLIMQSTFQYSPGLELSVLMPHGTESQERYTLVSKTIRDNRVHLL